MWFAMSYSWQIGKSNWLIRLLMVGYVLTIVACFLNALPLVLKISLAVLVLCHAWRTVKKLTSENWQLDFDDENSWQILEASTTKNLQILPSTVISRYFIFLHYQIENQKFYRLIFKDALLPNINDYRQLLVTLKTSGFKNDDK
jgi:hypothetical protein